MDYYLITILLLLLTPLVLSYKWKGLRFNQSIILILLGILYIIWGVIVWTIYWSIAWLVWAWDIWVLLALCLHNYLVYIKNKY